jgi:uncharacterized protein YciI
VYYILFYDYVEDYMERRGTYRPDHFVLANAAYERGELVIAGALADPPDRGVLVFKGDGPAVAENFARNDPYVLNGVVTRWEVRPWTVVIGA